MKLENLEIFPWNENFETFIPEIDEQHKRLVLLLNKLANNLTEEKTLEIEETFNELAAYADFHFKSEEKVWKKHMGEHALTIEHKQSHDSFLPMVLDLKENNGNKTFHETIEEILLFLIKWLAFHIVDEDKRLALIIHSMNEGRDISEAKYISDSKMSGSMKTLIDAILNMYENLSIKAINLIRERKARIKAENELKKVNKKLEKLSITDQLTNLKNRRYFDEVFEKEFAQAKRNKTVFGIMIFDIDYFKKLNDTYGHQKGDEALVTVAAAILKVCKRPNDFCFRIGGEEFAIIITNEKIDTPEQLAKILQEEVAALKIPNENSEISDYLTLSIGIESKIPDENDSVDSILKIVDDRLYKAKDLGRNTIVKD